jgi:hypothetical protein
MLDNEPSGYKYVNISDFPTNNGNFLFASYDGAKAVICAKDGFINVSLYTGLEGGEGKFDDAFWEDLCEKLGERNIYLCTSSSLPFLKGYYINPKFMSLIATRISTEFARKMQHIVDSLEKR